MKEFLKLNPIIIDVRPENTYKTTIHPKGCVNINGTDMRKSEEKLP